MTKNHDLPQLDSLVQDHLKLDVLLLLSSSFKYDFFNISFRSA